MKFASLLSISTTAYGLAFDGPLPTPVTDLVYAALTGFSPAPTNNVRTLPDMFRRQQKAADSAICGYLDGDSAFPVSCTSSSSCIFSAPSSWFGCCLSSCAPLTRCIDSAAVSSCLDDSSCYNDPAAMACSASDAPFCVTMLASISQRTVNHWVCGATATSVMVVASATTGIGSVSAAADASVIRQGGPGSSGGAGAGALYLLTASGSATGQGAPSSVRSSGGGAVQTAGAMVGVAVGAFAVLL
ncbi:hypothetical protein BDU57DRAFT_556343 [Ampelomyces quisqualis]|uniref:Uncharacterized protein n=1 Tax=Ampelomyces quisqualis TaxID=50730 RepID=A0A6A5QMD1_AMPQU|nr:hypothetical protein BDU57DRAFT_556343 [Ampelomyces quisqualis]